MKANEKTATYKCSTYLFSMHNIFDNPHPFLRYDPACGWGFDSMTFIFSMHVVSSLLTLWMFLNVGESILWISGVVNSILGLIVCASQCWCRADG